MGNVLPDGLPHRHSNALLSRHDGCLAHMHMTGAPTKAAVQEADVIRPSLRVSVAHTQVPFLQQAVEMKVDAVHDVWHKCCECDDYEKFLSICMRRTSVSTFTLEKGLVCWRRGASCWGMPPQHPVRFPWKQSPIVLGFEGRVVYFLTSCVQGGAVVEFMDA
jgi:hypothetical protein